MEVSERKWVNPVLNIIGVKSLRLGGFHILYILVGSKNDVNTEEANKTNIYRNLKLDTLSGFLTYSLKEILFN